MVTNENRSPRRGAVAGGASNAPVGPEVGTRLSAQEIHDNVLQAAKEEMSRPAWDLVWSAVTAGLTIGWSFVGGAYAATLVAPEYRQAISAAVYPLGFILVIIGRSQLFTENTLEPVIPVLAHPSRATVAKMLRLWAIVLAGNMAGSAAFGALFANTSVVTPAVRESMLAIGGALFDGGFGTQFYHAIFAGWLIALTAWLVAATSQTGAQIFLIWLTTAPIAALNFRHSIAGSVEVFFVAASGHATWAAAGMFILPAVMGNIVGGVTFVAMLNHGQVSTAVVARARRKR
ncbi:MAG: formate/nitrite transporter family protein [Gemmatimonadaceae bacterium]